MIRYLSQSYHFQGMVRTVLVTLAIVSGALLSSKGAGLAVPYWPFSVEAWTQKPLDGAFWSYVHRLAALFLLLLGWKGSAKWVWWGLVAFAVATGAYGVKWGMPTWAVVAHALSAHLLAACVAALFIDLFKASSKRKLLFWAWGTPVLIASQIALGALLRHMPVYRVTGYVKAVYGLPWLVLVHVLLGLVVISVVCWTAFLCYRECERASRLATITMFCIALQFILGLGAYVFRLLSKTDLQPSVPLVTATLLHVVGGALTLSVQTALALKVTFPDHSTMEIGERIATRRDEH